jgi:UDP-N-acetylglucosamine 2-epimerase
VARRPRLLSIISSRPEIIQAAPLAAALAPRLDEILVHTGQHYDPEMSGDQISDTRLPPPAHVLDVGSRPDQEQLQLGEERIAAVIAAERPDAVLVRGDTNGTLSGARAAKAAGLPLLHVEAGLRSYRDDMPEERNRVQTDQMSDVLFAPVAHAVDNLEREGIEGDVHLTGDVLADALLAWAGRQGPPPPADRAYGLATVHRNYNTDDPARLQAVLDCLEAAGLPVVFPVHPRTRNRIAEDGLRVPDSVELVDPVPYTRMLALERGAEVILTDSGGVQREAYLWGVACVTLREETEWIETVDTGWNVLTGVDPEAVAAAIGRELPGDRPEVFGDGAAAEKIAGITVDYLTGRVPSEEAAA